LATYVERGSVKRVAGLVGGFVDIKMVGDMLRVVSGSKSKDLLRMISVGPNYFSVVS
jgi:hypothetical protein